MKCIFDYRLLRNSIVSLFSMRGHSNKHHTIIINAITIAGHHADQMGWDTVEMISFTINADPADDNIAQMLWVRRGEVSERSFYINIFKDGSLKII